MTDFKLNQFTAIDAADDQNQYIAALEAFDRIAELQELKQWARELGAVAQADSILDVGCGFGLETVRLAEISRPGSFVAGIDKSASFIDEARRRTQSARRAIAFYQGVAEDLPFDSNRFDYVRAERIICYLNDPARAVSEMSRVARSGGRLAFIEPDFRSNNINIPDRRLAERVLAFEAENAVATNWTPGCLYAIARRQGLKNIQAVTRLLVFPDDLAAVYYGMIGSNALEAEVISDQDHQAWKDAVEKLRTSGELFASIGYVLLTAEKI